MGKEASLLLQLPVVSPQTFKPTASPPHRSHGLWRELKPVRSQSAFLRGDLYMKPSRHRSVSQVPSGERQSTRGLLSCKINNHYIH